MSCHNFKSKMLVLSLRPPFSQMSERIQSHDNVAVAGCLHRFLLDLPSPVFPSHIFPRLVQIFNSSSSSTTTKALSSLLGLSNESSLSSVLSSPSPSSSSSSSTSSDWHPVHRATFHFLMAHLCRVWSIQASLSNSSKIRSNPLLLLETGVVGTGAGVVAGGGGGGGKGGGTGEFSGGHLPPTQLVSAFSSLLIAPSWPDVCQYVKIKPTVTQIVESLLFDLDWGENVRDLVAAVRALKPPPPPSRPPLPHPPPSSALAEPSKPTPPPSQLPQQQQLQYQKIHQGSQARTFSMQDQPQQGYNNNNNNNNNVGNISAPLQGALVPACTCYWGSISREDANNLLKGTLDGTFLLRDSFRDPQIPYALHVQFRGQSRPIQVRFIEE